MFEGTRLNIIGVLYAKDLILVDPDDHIEIGTVLTFRQEPFPCMENSHPIPAALEGHAPSFYASEANAVQMEGLYL